jgi:uncharacterized membrane protein YfcA
MNFIAILVASLVSLITSVFSVSVGGTSLVTVPVLILLGMSPKTAVATNMFALIFLSLSGAVGLKKASKKEHVNLLVVLSVLTVGGSFLGAKIILTIDQAFLKKVIAAVILAMACLLLFKRGAGSQVVQKRLSRTGLFSGFLLVFLLGIYGGFFSGGYVTLLSFALLLVFHWNFLQVAFASKVMNVFSSTTAFVLFYAGGLIDFSVGIPMAGAMSVGAFLGAKLAIEKGERWVRNLFFLVVAGLAMKLFFFG